MRNPDHKCVLDVLVEAGLGPWEAEDVALNHTCFPVSCEVAIEQARAYLAGKVCSVCGCGLPDGKTCCEEGR